LIFDFNNGLRHTPKVLLLHNSLDGLGLLAVGCLKGRKRPSNSRQDGHHERHIQHTYYTFYD
jgi:hypothetical protein